ncbi:MAG: response regulator [Proteobacteria bacterium]|nr:response regulator [Pseudomonadota bacterium]
MKILIVDDNAARYSDVVKAQETISQGNDVIESCSNIKDALTALETTAFDLLVVDMMLPQTAWDSNADPAGGVKILRYLQEDDSLHMPSYVIGITSATNDDSAVVDHFNNSSWTLIRAGSSDNWQERLNHLFAYAREALGRATTRGYDVDVCFVTALRKPELKAVTALNIEWELTDVLCDDSTFVKRGRLRTAAGKYLSVVAASAMRMGAVESAILTGKLIECFRPRLVIMTGICAGFEGKVSLGDVVVANPAWDWTSAKWEVDGDGNQKILPAPDYIGIDRTIAAQLSMLEEDAGFLSTLQDNWSGSESTSRLKIHIKPSASGAIVVADGFTLQTIQLTQNREVLGLEMEAYGVYAAVRAAANPRPLVVSMKGVCDFADPRKADKAQGYAAYTSAGVAFEYLRRFGVPR